MRVLHLFDPLKTLMYRALWALGDCVAQDYNESSILYLGNAITLVPKTLIWRAFVAPRGARFSGDFIKSVRTITLHHAGVPRDRWINIDVAGFLCRV